MNKVAVITGSREADLLIEALAQRGIGINPHADIVVIAPHPFDVDLMECALLSSRHKTRINLCRPEWVPIGADKWFNVNNASQAAEFVQNNNFKRALLAVGNTRLAPFYRLKNITLFTRSRNPPHPPPPPSGEVRPAKGPFTVDREVAAFQEMNIDCLVAHNAGGRGGWPKIEAARVLGLPVVLLNRPEPAEITTVNTVNDALIWVCDKLGLDVAAVST